jgi:plastocyanin
MKAFRAIAALGLLLLAGPAFAMTGQCQCSMSVVSGAAGMTLTSGTMVGPCGREMSLSKALTVSSMQTTAAAVKSLAPQRAADEVAAATTPVSVTDFQFTPGTFTIKQGDTVTWTWNGGFHSVTTVAGAPESFNSGDMSAGTFAHTFNKTGTYRYYCDIHGGDAGNGTAFGMSGSITVTAAPEPVGIAAAGVGILALLRRTRRTPLTR